MPAAHGGTMAMRHQTISWVKSGIRIFGYIMLGPIAPAAAFLLIVSEVFGVLEEIGHD